MHSPLALLRAQTSVIAQSVIKQLSTKSLPLREAGFTLLSTLVAVLSGGLEAQLSALVGAIEGVVKTSTGEGAGLSGAATGLKIQVLAFLGLIIRSHGNEVLGNGVGAKIVGLVLASVGDRFNKIAAEAFRSCTDLVRIMRPLGARTTSSSGQAEQQGHLETLFTTTLARLSTPDADEAVKSAGLLTLGTLLSHAGNTFERQSVEGALGLLKERLRNEVGRLTTVRVVGLVGSTESALYLPYANGGDGDEAYFEEWLRESVVEVAALLRKVERGLKVAAFECIARLIGSTSSSTGGKKVVLGETTIKALLADLQPLLSDGDMTLLPLALDTLFTLLLQHASTSTVAVQAIEAQIAKTILPSLLALVQSPLLIAGPSLEGLLGFFDAYVRAGADPSTLIAQLLQAVERGFASSASTSKKVVGVSGAGVGEEGVQRIVNGSRCVGIVVRGQRADEELVEKVVNEWEKTILVSSPANLVDMVTGADQAIRFRIVEQNVAFLVDFRLVDPR